jgi:hypothetical protein
VTGLIRTGTSQAPDLQLIFSDSSAKDFVGFDGLTNGYAIAVRMVQPFSRGTVQPSASHNSPVIDPNYFGDDRDMQTMIKG